MHFPKTLEPTRNVGFAVWMLSIASIALPCFGQFETSAVLGTVADPRGGVIQQAKVFLENIDTGTSQSTLTDANGNYQILEVRVGRYRVAAESIGFKKLQTPDFPVNVGARQRVDMTLEVGNVSETVKVEAAASL